MEIADVDFQIGCLLGDDEVHLWWVDLQAVAAREEHWSRTLSSDERLRAGRFHFEKDRRFYVATRSILRQLLAGYLAIPATDLTFTYSAREKPALGGSLANCGLTFNVSHSGGIALLACTRNRQIGADVEKIRSDFDTAAIAARFFSPKEQDQLAALPVEQRHEAFFRCWTRKEAYIKAGGEGLSLPLREFDVSLEPGSRDALLATRPNASEKELWSLRDLEARPGYAAAICVSGSDWRLVEGPGSANRKMGKPD